MIFGGNSKIYIIAVLLLTSCQTMKPYGGPLKKEFIENTTLTKEAAFVATEAYLAKWIVNSNYAIKMRDKAEGRLIAKVRYGCVGLKRPDVAFNIASTDVDMTVDVSIKDKKIKYEIEITGFERDLGQYGKVNQFVAEAKGQDASVNNCMEGLKSELYKALEVSKGKKEW